MTWISNWFSNMKPMDQPMAHDDLGIVLYYPTVEHFYQAMKFTDLEIRKSMSERLSPYVVKADAKTYKDMVRDDWFDINDRVMWTALSFKWRSDTSWGKMLLNTGTADIIEFNNWHDNYWGWCVCDRCKDKEHQDKLGKTLQLIRDKLRREVKYYDVA